MKDRRQFAFWELKRQPIPYVCQGCGKKTLQLDKFERKRKFCSLECMYKAQRDGTFPLPDQSKNRPETREKRLANLKLGPRANAERLREAEYIWRRCVECSEEFPAYVGPSITNPARFCSGKCQHRNWEKRQRAKA